MNALNVSFFSRRQMGLVVLLAIAVTFCCPNLGRAQWQTSEKGTLVGAAAGGAIGSAIGKKSGNPITGAILGAIGGGVVGNAIGEDVEQRRAYQQRNLYAQPAYQTYPAGNYPVQNSGVTLDQVVTLTRSGLSDEVIISHVESNGFHQTLSANDLIILKNNGVSDRVIAALQRPQRMASPAVQAPTTIVRPPVVVEEVHVVPGWYHRPPRPVYYHGPHHHHRSSFNLHFGF